MDARKFIQTVGTEVSSDFVKNRSILSFEEYLALFMHEPQPQLRNAAQYLQGRDRSLRHRAGAAPDRQDPPLQDLRLRRATATGASPARKRSRTRIYRLLGNFVRAGRINKLILLHGPNG